MSEMETIEEEPEIATTPKRDRRTRHTSLQSYLWEQVPRQLIEDAKRKAKAQTPPTNVKRVLVGLLRDWTYAS